jgi:hypothetical protein
MRHSLRYHLKIYLHTANAPCLSVAQKYHHRRSKKHPGMGGGRGDVSRLGMHAMQAGWSVLLERVVEHHQLHTASQGVSGTPYAHLDTA